MFLRKKLNDKRNVVIVMCGLILLSTPAQALNDGDLQRAILDARALGDTGASVKTDGTTAVVTTYLAAKDNISTCKAKAVLVAKTLFDKVKTLALVRLIFFVPNNTRQYVSVEVGEGAIKSFAAGQTTMAKLIASIPYQDNRRAAAASTSSSSQSGNPAVRKGLQGLVPLTGTVDIAQRQAQMSMMEACQAQGIDVSSAIQEFNKEQTSIESVDMAGYTKHFNNCSMLIEGYNNMAVNQARSGGTSSPVKPGRLEGQRTTIWKRLQGLRGADKYLRWKTKFDAIEDMVDNTTIDDATVSNMIQSLYAEIR
jgi:hypothetical protein